MTGFAIYDVAVGAGWVGISPMPRAGDLDAVWAWGPQIVISMTSRQEMDAAGGADLDAAAKTVGIAWHCIPVVDYGVPDAAAETLWADVAYVAAAALAQGERILIHCMGGCGRSGMAALRLMIDAGEDNPTALTRLRKARPCAVETDAQLAWAQA